MSKLTAIRMVRDRAALPLREAKELVEAVERDLLKDAAPELPAMTLRDQFAAAALQGYLAGMGEGGYWKEDDLAAAAYAASDAMLKAREPARVSPAHTPADPDEPETVECGTCGGSGKITHEAVYTGPNPHSACAETCETCDGKGEVPA